MPAIPRARILFKQKVKAYRWLYEFTKSQCSDCEATDCACKDSICSHVQTQARRDGIELKTTGHRLRFIGCSGCVVPPHQRETCTIFLCNKAQARRNFPHATYQRLKDLCARIEDKLMRLEEPSTY